MLKMYDTLASWWPLLSAPADYEEEAAFYGEALAGGCEGLFSRATWLRLLSEPGFEPRVVPFEHSELEPGSHDVFVARRP